MTLQEILKAKVLDDKAVEEKDCNGKRVHTLLGHGETEC